MHLSIMQSLYLHVSGAIGPWLSPGPSLFFIHVERSTTLFSHHKSFYFYFVGLGRGVLRISLGRTHQKTIVDVAKHWSFRTIDLLHGMVDRL